MKSPIKTMVAASCLVLAWSPVTAQKTREVVDAAPAAAVRTEATLSQTPEETPVRGRVIVVSLQDRRLALVEDGAVKKVYRVAVGSDRTPSPTGTFTIVGRVANPTYYHEGKVVPPGPDNPVGTRWMGLNKKGYGIHGTNAPRSIGKAASHGCIRMGQRDLEDLYAQVRSGDTVEIVGERNEETAAIFGGVPVAPGMVVSAQTLTAQITPEAVTAEQSAAAAGNGVVPADK
jgi:lipoprotein-anchoring transpeptidase ErfK/SrfK